MGGPMAGHLLNAGAELVVWSRTPNRVEPLQAGGATVAQSLEELGSQCEVVFLCVNRTEDVRECLESMIPRAQPNTLFVDHSTILPSAARAIHSWLASLGLRFVDAPITGGSVGAQKGELTVFCGGEPEAVEDAITAMKPYVKRAERVGGPGAGQLMKVANQIAVAGALIGLCESLSFATKAGLDLAQTQRLLAGGAAGSWAFDHYGPKVLARDWSPGFTIRNQRKDFGYCKQAAEEIGCAIPCTALVDSLLLDFEEEGKGEWTTAALYERLLNLSEA